MYRFIPSRYPKQQILYVFWSFGYYFDHFWYKFWVLFWSETCHNTYFRDDYNLSPVQGSYMVYVIPTEREDMLMGTILMSQWINHHSGNPFYKSEFSRWFGIMIDFVLFVCQHTMKWTLTLLVCWYIYYEGLPIGRTWRLYLNFWCNGCRFDEHLGNI